MSEPRRGREGDGHRKRLREKFLRAGDKAFFDYELLELILSYAIPRRDVKPLAKRLLTRFKTLGGLLDTAPAELMAEEGVGESAAILIKLIRTFMVKYLEQNLRQAEFMDSAEQFCDYARARLGEYDNEAMMIFFLNTQNMLIDVEVISEGAVDCVVVFPSVVAKRALMYSAKSVVLCHNHPSGVVTPSKADNRVTLEVRTALAPLKIQLLDHIIVSKFGYYSYRYADRKKAGAFRMLEPLEEVCRETGTGGKYTCDFLVAEEETVDRKEQKTEEENS